MGTLWLVDKIEKPDVQTSLHGPFKDKFRQISFFNAEKFNEIPRQNILRIRIGRNQSGNKAIKELF
jgi:hypothetical protein